MSEVIFPLSCNPYSDESGLGFCLRAASKNGANFHAIRRLLGMPDMVEFTQTHAAVLTRLFQTELDWLQRTLPPTGKAMTFDWCEHRWCSPYQLRKKPQICPYCVHHRGYTKAVWDVGLSTLCVDHCCWLVDDCIDCGQRLRWDRPSVEVGHCGHIVKARAPRGVPDAGHIAFQRELEDRFNHGLALEASIFPKDVTYGISLDCWLGIALALGLKEHAFQAIRQLNKQRTTQEWIAIGSRAIKRAPLAKEINQLNIFESSAIVAEAPLFRIVKYAAEWNDITAASTVLRGFFGDKATDHSGLHLPRVNQLELF